MLQLKDGLVSLKTQLLRKYILFVCKESTLNISKSRCCKALINEGHDNGLASQDIWKKKEKELHNNFLRTSLSQALKNAETLPSKIRRINEDLCMYCGKGQLQFVADWFACERCNGWVHQVCINNQETISDHFICKFCETAIQESKAEEGINELLTNDKTDNFKLTCFSYYDKNYRKSAQELFEIEMATREQRLSHKWFEERRKRVTASYFGRICNSKNNNSLTNIFNSMGSNFTNSAIQYDIDNEINAVALYEAQTSKKCNKCGLTIHKLYQFIAGSPDGLVSNNGIIEIKCPYSYRNSDGYSMHQRVI